MSSGVKEAGLTPDDGVDQRRASVCGRTDTESSTLDVAPVTPCIADVLHTRASLLDNEVGREATGFQHWCQSLKRVISWEACNMYMSPLTLI